FLQQQHRLARKLYLVSASSQKLVNRVAQHLPLFEASQGSDEKTNLKGAAKLQAIKKLAGSSDFDYAGNESADLAIWEKSANAITVNASPNLKSRAAQVTNVSQSFDRDVAGLKNLFKAMRLHQWLKNGLLFLPPALAHQLGDIDSFVSVLLAFLSFSLCASSVYLLNDLLDLEADRQHTSKRLRPFAAGTLPLSWGLVASPILLLAAFSLALQLPMAFVLILAIYYLLTLFYSFALKSVAIVDVLVLAGLYTLRIIAGAVAISVTPTFWLLAFSMFLFLSLAIVKRFTELDNLRNQNRHQVAGRGYLAGDIQVMSMLGSASGFMAVLVFALYINAEETRRLYATPEILWLICPLLLYLISRIWLLAHRGVLHEDPVVFAITDHRSQFVVLMCALLVWAATGTWLN
ncbi:MAG: UbiA family prenyltransferase, partial [Pseudohongiellaceae bacterium]